MCRGSLQEEDPFLPTVFGLGHETCVWQAYITDLLQMCLSICPHHEQSVPLLGDLMQT
jgi:hypothetical protein